MSKVQKWILAIRPRTLVISVMPVFIGAVLAFNDSAEIDWWLFLGCILCCIFIQIGTNLFNDAIDFKQGADTADRLGPPRVTQSGLIASDSVLVAAVLAYLLAVLFSIPLVMHGGWVIVVIGIFSMYCGYAYSAGPLNIAHKGMGEIFVILFFGLTAVAGTYYLQSLAISPSSLVAGLQTGLLASVVLAINNMRDVNEDAISGKKTLAVRFGTTFAAYEIMCLIVLAFVLSMYWAFTGRFMALVLPLITLPLAVKVIKNVFKTPVGRIYNDYLYQSILLFFYFCLLLGTGILMSF